MAGRLRYRRGVTRTIGVSIPVPEPWGEQVRTLRQGFGDDQATGIPTHITLLGPTVVRRASTDRLQAHLAAAAASVAPFSIEIHGTGTFLPVSPVVFLHVARGVASCEQLESAIRRPPITRQLEFPYHPHVTLAQGVTEAALDRAFGELAEFTCRFPVDGFDLYEFGDDCVWRPIQSFRLSGPPGPTGR